MNEMKSGIRVKNTLKKTKLFDFGIARYSVIDFDSVSAYVIARCKRCESRMHVFSDKNKSWDYLRCPDCKDCVVSFSDVFLIKIKC